MKIPFQLNDGGRAAAGFKGQTRDCVARSIAIASGQPYLAVYQALAKGNAAERRTRRSRRPSGRCSARDGIHTTRKWFKTYMAGLGFRWTPTMAIGQGCKVHLKADELPPGKLVVAVSHHYCAVLDGVLHDLRDCSRGGTRCVYGFWRLGEDSAAAPGGL